MERADQDGSRRTTASAEISRPEMGGDGAAAPPLPPPHACKPKHHLERLTATNVLLRQRMRCYVSAVAYRLLLVATECRSLFVWIPC